MKDIKLLRSEIDTIDNKLIELFQQRMEIVLSIAEYKKENNIEIFNANREQEILLRGDGMLLNDSFKVPLHKFLNGIMKISKEVQSKALYTTIEKGQ